MLKDDYLSVTPTEGKIMPEKSISVTFCINLKKEIEWKRENLFSIIILDPNKGNELIAKIPICVSLNSHLPR